MATTISGTAISASTITAGTLLTEAFMIAGIDSPTTTQTTSALNSLNSMVSFMGAESLAHAVVSQSHTLTINDAEYTIGSGGDIDTVRPSSVKNCYLRDADGIDHYVRVLNGKRYNQIADKDYVACPNYLYFLPEYPLAKIIFNSAPDYAYTAYFEFEKPVTEFSTTATALSMPPEYREFIVYNMAVKIAEKWDRILQQSVYTHAQYTKDVISTLLASLAPPSESKFDLISGGFKRDILTDSIIDVE